MSRATITPALRRAVAERSGYRCSYCQTAERLTGSQLTVDHIIPESLGGQTTLDNLCLACWECNLLKHDRIVATDPESGTTVRLFNPNAQLWHEHFTWHMAGILVIGLTPTGRATVNALRLNRPVLVSARRLWVQIGGHPPSG